METKQQLFNKHRRPLGLLMRTWLLLLPLLCLSMTAQAKNYDTGKPTLEKLSASNSLSLTDPVIHLKWKFFCFKDNNAGYEGDPVLYINNQEIGYISGIQHVKLSGDKWVDDGNPKGISEGVLKDEETITYFKGKTYLWPYGGSSDSFGMVHGAGAHLREESGNWMVMDLAIAIYALPKDALSSSYLDIKIVGYWLDKNDGGKEYEDYECSCSYPVSFPTMPSYSIAREQDKKVKVTLNSLSIGQATATPYQTGAASVTDSWKYKFRVGKTQVDKTKCAGFYYPYNNEPYEYYNLATGTNTLMPWAESEPDRAYLAEGSNAGDFYVCIDDNWKAYPLCIGAKKYLDDFMMYISMDGNNSHPDWSRDAMPGFMKFDDVVWANGNPRPKNITIPDAEKDTYKKKITVKWSADIDNSDHVNRNGAWYIFRQVKDDPTTKRKLGTVADSNRDDFSYDDKTDLEYGKTYVYTVCYCPKNWTVDSEEDAEGLWGSQETTLERSFSFTSASATAENGTIVLEWTHPSISDASGSKKYLVQVQRSDNASSGWVDYGSAVAVTSPDTKSGTFTDDNIEVHKPYYYRLHLYVEERDVYSEDTVTATVESGSFITSFTASRGSYTTSVKLNWTVNQVGSSPTYFMVQRRPLGSQKESDWAGIYPTSGTGSTYSYEDQTAAPGSFNEYRLMIWNEYKGTAYYNTPETTDGFALTTGVVGGRVAYGSGTAVKDVAITLKATDPDGKELKSFRSLQFDGTKGLTYQPEDGRVTMEQIFGKNFTVQFYVKATESNQYKYIMSVKDGFGFAVFGSNLRFYGNYGMNDSYAYQTLLKNLPIDKWAHVTIVYDSNTARLKAYQTENGKIVNRDSLFTKQQTWTDDMSNLTIGSRGDSGFFTGKLDEFRVFSRALTTDEILKNYDHMLTGSEDSLQVYYPLDEGLQDQFLAYDYSRTNGVMNGHHATNKEKVGSSSDDVSKEIGLKAYTDKEGNYTLRGIPFSGEGTNYVITPTLGIHQFNPGNKSRFFNVNSLSYTGVDFEDVSSFPVSGTVYFQNTNIPVADAYLYVDGMICSRDGEAIKTAADGTYTIDVPIGDHFITVKKSGHVFAKGGRWPEDTDSLGLRKTFEKAYSDVNFYDSTYVTVAGRVAGGDVQTKKPLCLGQSIANIGQATLTLTFANNETKSINTCLNDLAEIVQNEESGRDFENTKNEKGNDVVNCSAKVLKGENTVTIETDPETGEFAVQLPPLLYTVDAVEVKGNSELTFSKVQIDATNPQMVYTDTLKGTGKEFKYCASAKMEYVAPTTFDVIENEDGSFGMKQTKVKNVRGEQVVVPFYKKNGNKWDYTYGYPVYQEMDSYTYTLHAYERYVRNDRGTEEEDQVPLVKADVEITNEYSTQATVYTDEDKKGKIFETKTVKLQLDSMGYANYSFRAGLPNVQPDFTRTFSMKYKTGGVEKTWTPNSPNFTGKAIVIGSLPTGNNFVTEGPDEVEYVLRDPPGSMSYASWLKGKTITTTKTLDFTQTLEEGVTITILAGLSIKVANGIGMAKIDESKVSETGAAGLKTTAEVGSSSSWTDITTTTDEIRTSDNAQFVGAPADVFIGESKNLVFGLAHQLGIFLDDDNQPVLDVREVTTMGEEFKTHFVFAAQHIENVLIPELEGLRDGLLQYDPDPSSVTNSGTEPIYVTKWKPGDKQYASDNDDIEMWQAEAKPFKYTKGDTRFDGPSYSIIYPSGLKQFQDMVCYYNNSIRNWKQRLADNEEAKVKAIEGSSEYLKKNESLSAGTSITGSTETHDAHMNSAVQHEHVNILTEFQTGGTVNDFGSRLDVTIGLETDFRETEGSETDDFEVSSYTLAESGDDDYLSIDVFDAPDNFGSIFYTRAGATSCPYEDEVVTKYYQPGTKIAEKTIQIEKPEIEATTAYITGIPAGGKGTFQVYIRNNSDTKEDGLYNINVVAGSNPNGLVVTMDGLNLAAGRAFMVKAGETLVKTITVEQSILDSLNYENVQLRIASQCQPDNTGIYPEIADTTTFSAYFQAACSDIKLASTHTLVNTATKTPVTLTVSGYNYSMSSLQAVVLQYKGENEAEFRELKRYVKDEDLVASNPNWALLPVPDGNSKLQFNIDLRDEAKYTDNTYVFRAITECKFDGSIVNNESDEIKVVRDMNRPMLIATPSPSSGILNNGTDLTITFNEDIKASSLDKNLNFSVTGVLNEAEVVHDVALSLDGENVAKTEATMDLSDKSFSASMWLNYQSGGRLLQHGATGNEFAVDIENGKLAVTVAGTKTVSTKMLPTNKWLYLNVSYDAGNEDIKPTVSAGYAQDAETVILFGDEETAAYEGNGPVSLGGNGLLAKVQELAIWNDSRTMADAQADMYTTKSQYTNGLLGYWQMNEGHGNVATDKARSRQMTLPSENAWWIDGDNYALVLDGTKAAAASIGSLNTTASEDYLVETWFKADEEQAGVASVLSTQAMDLRLNEQGKMEMVLNGSPVEVMNNDLRDGQWHHVAVNVLKSTNGSGIVYVDGQQRKQIAASAMPALYGEMLVLGGHRVDPAGMAFDQMLKGAIDEVRIWKARRTADVIKDNMFNRVNGDEAGLEGYYPMERFSLDGAGQQMSTANLNDASNSPTGVNAGALAFYNVGGANVNGEANKKNTAALKMAPARSKVAFSFVASERQITVNLQEAPATIEGCNIYITAKDVKDVNGNAALPITWGVYVQQNSLTWENNQMEVTKNGNEETTFTAVIENNGSETENWSLSGMPSWLTASKEAGSLKPQTTGTVTFKVSPSLPIGTYETTVYLTGLQGINAPLDITVSSEGDAPNWVATPGENTMNVMGVLTIDGVQSSDTKDMVAAFRGTECVGVARPKYFSRYDAYMVMLNIYGKEEAELTYKAYDASTGTVYPSVSISDQSAFTFVSDKTVGSFNKPVVFTPLNEIEQDLSLDRSEWKWFSFYAQPKTNDMSVIFKDAKGVILCVTDGNSSVVNWQGVLDPISFDKMYKLKATEPYEEYLVGEPAEASNVEIKLNKGWTWIGYPCQASNSLDAAFASAEPQEGDMVKNQSGFSIYTGGGWYGLLNAMQPGDGYMYNNTASAEKTFKFPKPAISGRRNAPARVNKAETTRETTMRDNMTMIAVVMNGEEMIENAEVSVYAGTELRGMSEAPVKDGRHFITIGGEDAEMLTFVVKTAEQEYMLQQTDLFMADAMRGTMAEPYVLQLAQTTGIDLAGNGVDIKHVQLIDGSGRVVNSSTQKLFTKDDLKRMPAGVYYQQVTYANGQTRVQKLMR